MTVSVRCDGRTGPLHPMASVGIERSCCTTTRSEGEPDVVTFRRDVPLDAADIIRVFDGSGLRRPTHDPERIERMFRHANLVFSAWSDEGQLIGVCRSLTDFSYCCYLSDLAVARDHQKSGIGVKMIRLTREAIGPECALILLSAPGAMAYYPRIGFDRIENGFIIPRSR